ncbi:MAG: hypothetical protein UD759_05435 [Clostridia bacterium]|nr:hypothetical protein [Clostridia bacterium]
MNEYQCIFCGRKIERNTEKITSLLITANWENEKNHEDQQVFCHLKCLKTKCENPANIYIDDE